MFHWKEIGLGIALALCITAAANAAIKGVVFNDLNANGARDAGEPGIADVPVSDQTLIVKTNAQGEYELPDAEHVTVFVNTPAQWQAARDKVTGVPQFFKNFHAKNQGMFTATAPMPSSVDFALTKRADGDSKTFEAVILGDSQLPVRHFPSYKADIVDELLGMKNKPEFVLTLGDISSENLSSFPDIARMTAAAGSAVYGVLGNHDRDKKATNFVESSATYKKTYGPDYYSFDRGDVHFLILNSIFFTGDGGATYGTGFDKPQLEWMKQDLANTPKDKLLMICLHAPLCGRQGRVNFTGKNEFFAMLKDWEAPIVTLGAHWHTTNAFQLKAEDGWLGAQPFTMAIVPHSCGSWWAGPAKENGLPLAHQSDGTPNGLTMWKFDGTKYSVAFQPSGMSINQQSRIYTPDQRCIMYNKDGLSPDTILVNAFFTWYDADVQYSIDGGEWKSMEKVTNLKDPYMESKMENAYAGTPGWIRIQKSDHLWKANPGTLAKGSHTVKIRIPAIDGSVVEQGKMFTSYE